MKYECTAVFSTYGILPRAGQDHVLIQDEDSGLCALLTSEPDGLLTHADRSHAIGSIRILGLVSGGGFPEGDLDEHLAKIVDEIREARKKMFGQSAFIVITVQGEAELDEPRAQYETDNFVVWVDGGNERAVRTRHEAQLPAALNCVILYGEKVGGLRLVGDSVTYFRDDGKPIYASTVTIELGTPCVSSPIRDDAEVTIQKLYNGTVVHKGLARVLRLLRRSFEAEDRFQAFLSAWLALEILIQKMFSEYEGRYFNDWKGRSGSRSEKLFLFRIKEVMKDKYGIADKFAAIAMQLDPSNADGDLEVVEHAKKQRDAISHGESLVEAQLPLEQIQAVARKYLLLHLEAKALTP